MKQYLYKDSGLYLIYIGVMLQILSAFQFMKEYKNALIIIGLLCIASGFIIYLQFRKKQN
jgi:hypothetical protein